MYHSKEIAFTFIMMLVLSRCTVSFNNYSTLYTGHKKKGILGHKTV